MTNKFQNKLPEAVIFDWDNTLVDSWPLIHFAINETMKVVGGELWSLDRVKGHIHKSMRDIFPDIFGEKWVEAAEIYKKSYRSQHLEKMVFLPDALKLIDALCERNIPLFIISNKIGDVVRMESDNLGISNKFLKILGAGDTDFDKPHRAMVDLALNDTRINPKKDLIWFIGDTIVDIECALNTGCQPVLYGEGINVPEELILREGSKNEKPLIWFKSHQEIINQLH